jgi:glycine/D-amino acid oxidase-like deaminating enzyme
MYAKPDGLAWCGTTEDWRGFDRQSLPETRDRILAGVKRILPAVSDATIEMQTACLRPVTPDWLPILGQVKGYQNAWLATGAGKKGILLAPGIGKSVAGLITKSETDLSIQDYSPERFASWRGS